MSDANQEEKTGTSEPDTSAVPAAPTPASEPIPWKKPHQLRRRIATVVMVILFALLLTHGTNVLPSTLEFSVPLEDASSITHVEATLIDAEGEEAHRISRRFTGGSAPESLDLSVELLPGLYAIEVRTSRVGFSTLRVGEVEVPSEGRVRVRLHAP